MQGGSCSDVSLNKGFNWNSWSPCVEFRAANLFGSVGERLSQPLPLIDTCKVQITQLNNQPKKKKKPINSKGNLKEEKQCREWNYWVKLEFCPRQRLNLVHLLVKLGLNPILVIIFLILIHFNILLSIFIFLTLVHFDFWIFEKRY